MRRAFASARAVPSHSFSLRPRLLLSDAVTPPFETSSAPPVWRSATFACHLRRSASCGRAVASGTSQIEKPSVRRNPRRDVHSGGYPSPFGVFKNADASIRVSSPPGSFPMYHDQRGSIVRQVGRTGFGSQRLAQATVCTNLLSDRELQSRRLGRQLVRRLKEAVLGANHGPMTVRAGGQRPDWPLAPSWCAAGPSSSGS